MNRQLMVVNLSKNIKVYFNNKIECVSEKLMNIFVEFSFFSHKKDFPLQGDGDKEIRISIYVLIFHNKKHK